MALDADQIAADARRARPAPHAAAARRGRRGRRGLVEREPRAGLRRRARALPRARPHHRVSHPRVAQRDRRPAPRARARPLRSLRARRRGARAHRGLQPLRPRAWSSPTATCSAVVDAAARQTGYRITEHFLQLSGAVRRLRRRGRTPASAGREMTRRRRVSRWSASPLLGRRPACSPPAAVRGRGRRRQRASGAARRGRRRELPRRHRPERGRRPLHGAHARPARRRPARLRADAADLARGGRRRPRDRQRRRPRRAAARRRSRTPAARRRIVDASAGLQSRTPQPGEPPLDRRPRPTRTSGSTRCWRRPTWPTSATRSRRRTRTGRPTYEANAAAYTAQARRARRLDQEPGRADPAAEPQARDEPRQPRVLRRPLRLLGRRHGHPQRRHRRDADGAAARRPHGGHPRRAAPRRSSWRPTRTPKLAEQIAAETGITVVDDLLDHSLTAPDGVAPTYIDMMKFDTRRIVEALK